jgi:hypothetical protein
MKKLLLSLSIIMLLSLTLSAQDTLVTYKFKVANDSSQTFGNAYNVDNIVLRDTSYHVKLIYSSGVDGTAPADFRLSSTGWASGLDVKYYYTYFASTAYTNILISSRQKSSSTGPKDFKLQYMVGIGGTWTDVTGGAYSCANDAFILGTLTNVPLGTDANNQPVVLLRWVMTSNVSVNLGTVASTGTSGIDNIFIIGTPVGVGINNNNLSESISIYPNPSNGNFVINNPSENNLTVDVLNILGSSVLKTQSSEKYININLESALKGIYFVQLENKQGQKIVKKLIIK